MSRRLAAAERGALALACEILVEQLQISASELCSLIQIVRSQLDLSLSAALLEP
jgi:hypothetical protein